MISKQKLKKDKEKELQRKIFVGGLSSHTDEAVLEQYFSKYGKIEDILVNRFSKTGVSKGCAFILFEKAKIAQELINGDETHRVGGKRVDVKECHRKAAKISKKSSSSGTKSPRENIPAWGGFEKNNLNSGFSEMLSTLKFDHQRKFVHFASNLSFNKIPRKK